MSNWKKSLVGIIVVVIVGSYLGVSHFTSEEKSAEELPPSIDLQISGTSKLGGSINNSCIPNGHSFTGLDVAGFEAPAGREKTLEAGIHIYHADRDITFQQVVDSIEPDSENRILIVAYNPINNPERKFLIYPTVNSDLVLPVNNPSRETIAANNGFIIASCKDAKMWNIKSETEEGAGLPGNIGAVENNWILFAGNPRVNLSQHNITSVFLQNGAGPQFPRGGDFDTLDLESLRDGNYTTMWLKVAAPEVDAAVESVVQIEEEDSSVVDDQAAALAAQQAQAQAEAIARVEAQAQAERDRAQAQAEAEAFAQAERDRAQAQAEAEAFAQAERDRAQAQAEAQANMDQLLVQGLEGEIRSLEIEVSRLETEVSRLETELEDEGEIFNDLLANNQRAASELYHAQQNVRATREEMVAIDPEYLDQYLERELTPALRAQLVDRFRVLVSQEQSRHDLIKDDLETRCTRFRNTGVPPNSTACAELMALEQSLENAQADYGDIEVKIAAVERAEYRLVRATAAHNDTNQALEEKGNELMDIANQLIAARADLQRLQEAATAARADLQRFQDAAAAQR